MPTEKRNIIELRSSVIDERDFDDPYFKLVIENIHQKIGAPAMYNNAVGGRAGSYIQGTKNWEYPRLITWLEEFLKPGMVVMDAGGGGGALQIYLPSYGMKVKVVDIHETHPEFNQEFGIQNEYFLDDLENLHFEKESLDAIFCVSVLEHMSHPGLALKEFFRVLKPGAFAGISVDWMGGSPFDYENFSPLLSEAGFEYDLSALASVSEEEALKRKEFILDCPPWSVAAFTIRKKGLSRDEI